VLRNGEFTVPGSERKELTAPESIQSPKRTNSPPVTSVTSPSGSTATTYWPSSTSRVDQSVNAPIAPANTFFAS